MPFTTLAAVKAALNITESGDDALISQLIPQVDDLFATLLGRDIFNAAGIVEYPVVRGVDTTMLFLRRWPEVVVNSLWVSTDYPRVFDATTLLTEDENYIVEPDTGIVHRVGDYWTRSPRAIKVDYDGGYSTVPGDLARAAEEVISVKLQKGKGRLYHLMAQEVGSGEVRGIRFEDVPPNALAVLRSYREVRV